jgi:hypothetical protein
MELGLGSKFQRQGLPQADENMASIEEEMGRWA